MKKKFHLKISGIMFIIVHLMCLTVFWIGWDWTGLGMCALFFFIRKFGITGGFHRYFSHRSYKTGRIFQFILAFIGGASAQKGAIWWAAHHRHHHKHSDTDEDLHSAELEGFFWSHVGWVLSDEYEKFDARTVQDLMKFPELVFLDKHMYIAPVLLGTFCFWWHGMIGLVWGFFVSTVILYHTTFAINSLCHMFGKPRYETGEASKNCLWLALLTLGEGWHNNHHHYHLSCRQGFFWWEIDISYYIIKMLSWFGIVWDIQAPPAHLLQPEAMLPKKSKASLKMPVSIVKP